MFFPTVEIVDFKATVGPPISYAVDTPIPKERATVHPAEASKVCARRGRGRGRGACSQPLSDAKSRVARYRHDQL